MTFVMASARYTPEIGELAIKSTKGSETPSGHGKKVHPFLLDFQRETLPTQKKQVEERVGGTGPPEEMSRGTHQKHRRPRGFGHVRVVHAHHGAHRWEAHAIHHDLRVPRLKVMAGLPKSGTALLRSSWSPCKKVSTQGKVASTKRHQDKVGFGLGSFTVSLQSKVGLGLV